MGLLQTNDSIKPNNYGCSTHVDNLPRVESKKIEMGVNPILYRPATLYRRDCVAVTESAYLSSRARDLAFETDAKKDFSPEFILSKVEGARNDNTTSLRNKATFGKNRQRLAERAIGQRRKSYARRANVLGLSG